MDTDKIIKYLQLLSRNTLIGKDCKPLLLEAIHIISNNIPKVNVIVKSTLVEDLKKIIKLKDQQLKRAGVPTVFITIRDVPGNIELKINDNGNSPQKIKVAIKEFIEQTKVKRNDSN